MKAALVGLVLGAIGAALGWAFAAPPYRLRDAGMPGDQAVLAHRTSAYSDITWMVAASDDRMELRFFDRVEGGVCPKPSWADLRALAAKDERLAHLVGDPATAPAAAPAATWPKDLPTPDPGTLTHTKYISLLPLGPLLNHRLMAAAGGDPRKAAPRVLVVGFGSGIGIATLAHHYPQAAITVVDIDREVIEMVEAHFPLLRWLTTQKTATGEPRLRLVCRDARQYIRYDAGDAAAAGKPLDLMVFDAYTSGSTIPPHLMTVEFFAECARALGEDGVFLANIIGSYKGEKRKVLGGAIRSLRHPTCGLTHVRSFPILQEHEYADGMAATDTRNNIVVASRAPLVDAETWKRVLAFTPWPELEPGAYVTEVVYPASLPMTDSRIGRAAIGSFLAWPVDQATANLRGRFKPLEARPDLQHQRFFATDDAEVMQRLRAAVAALPSSRERPAQVGWDDAEVKAIVIRREDWVLHARETWQKSVSEGRDDRHDGEALVGPVDDGKPRGRPTWAIADAPLFTDARPNADIFNAE